jgi:predicted Zn-dependent protease
MEVIILLSLVDTEAQPAYLLGHEITHIEKKHWLQDAMVATELEDRARSREKTAAIAGVAGGLIGGLASKSAGKGIGIGLLTGVGTYAVLKFIGESKTFD